MKFHAYSDHVLVAVFAYGETPCYFGTRGQELRQRIESQQEIELPHDSAAQVPGDWLRWATRSLLPTLASGAFVRCYPASHDAWTG